MKPGHAVVAARHDVDGRQRRQDVQRLVHGLAGAAKMAGKFCGGGRVGGDALECEADGGRGWPGIVQEEGIQRAAAPRLQAVVARRGRFLQMFEVEQPSGFVGIEVGRTMQLRRRAQMLGDRVVNARQYRRAG